MSETVDGARYFAEAQTEREFMAAVIAYAKARGWLVYHTHDSRRSAEGFPDLCMVRAGRLVFAELKREKGGGLSRAQDQWIRAIKQVTKAVADEIHDAQVGQCAGGCAVRAAHRLFAYVWRPSMWPEIEAVLR